MKNKLKFEIILIVVTLFVIKVDFFAIKMKNFHYESGNLRYNPENTVKIIIIIVIRIFKYQMN